MVSGQNLLVSPRIKNFGEIHVFRCFVPRFVKGCVIAWGPAADTLTATQEIRNRIVEAFDGVPNETRQYLRDGLTDFERILPGADRMYPDTDHPPVRIAPERVARIKAGLPEPTYKVEERFRKYGLPEDTIRDLALSERIVLIDRLAKKGRGMKLVGRLLGQTVRSLRRQGIDCSGVDENAWVALLDACAAKRIQPRHFEEILANSIQNQGTPLDEIIEVVTRPA